MTQDDYRPPSSPLGDSRSRAPRHSLAGAIAVGVVATVGCFSVLSIAVAAAVALNDPSVAESEVLFERAIRGLPFYTQLTGGIYALSGLVGAWCATRWKRGRWLACALGVGGVLVSLGLLLSIARAGSLSRTALIYLLLPAGALLGGFLARDTEVR